MTMKLSKLEACLQILQIAKNNASLKQNDLITEFGIGKKTMDPCLKLLFEQKLITQNKNENQPTLQITRAGFNVLQYFKMETPSKKLPSF